MEGYWTIEQVQEYLGHTVPESTQVWLSRHGIKPVRLYPIEEVTSEREPNKVGTYTKPVSAIQTKK